MESTRKGLWLLLVLLAVAVAPTAAQVWTTIGGDGTPAFNDGILTASQFYQPFGVAVGTDGNVYVADVDNNCIRKFTAATSAWSTIGTSTFIFARGDTFSAPNGVAVGADGNVYVADTGRACIRMFTAANSTWSTIGGRDGELLLIVKTCASASSLSPLRGRPSAATAGLVIQTTTCLTVGSTILWAWRWAPTATSTSQMPTTTASM